MIAHSVLGNRQWLDGGAMFGNVPRPLWSRWCPPDEIGRIELACRALLIDEGPRKVLFETGIGAFFEPRLRERFGVIEARHVLLDSLASLGLSDADVDVVVLSHLHFDHAGGLLAAFREGEAARLLFPRARFVVGRTAFERADRPHLRDRASFIPELPRLLRESGRLELVDAGRDSDLLGGRYRFTESSGHTPGLLHTHVLGRQIQLFFCADLIPGVPWVHLPVTMGYDRAPEALIDEKASVLSGLAERGAWLFFTHDARVAAARPVRDATGKWTAVDARADDAGPWQLD